MTMKEYKHKAHSDSKQLPPARHTIHKSHLWMTCENQMLRATENCYGTPMAVMSST